ncbi:hypothetical protein V565_207430 [Rhizoctonia solani 123E]|uniref:Uncharacterized protein n=1 Tax=Rhizoctonia solani 123E TaxID=1423351 RepID=A0A074S8F6_9AGAM|nr:hypothetical protein V565_207430 [Rhizoctonia solani 123E]
MMDNQMTALELVLTFLTMFGPVTKESLAAVCVLFEAVLGYDYTKGKFDKDAVKKVSGVADHLLAMAELYGVNCDPRQLETPGGRRAILRVIIGPIIQGLTLESLERIRNDAVEAMMVLTFKSIDEVQDMVDVWEEQAIEDGRYQSRVYSWTGQSMEVTGEAIDTDPSTHLGMPTANESAIAAAGGQCILALEIMFTFLTMFGPITEESVEATRVLFGAVIGYSEATGKFDKETVKKVRTVAEQLCAFARLYGVRCEPKMLDTPPGARAILREIVGPIIEGHSPDELKQISNDATEVEAVLTFAPLDEVRLLASVWANAARQEGRYQMRASTWTGKPLDIFNEDGSKSDQIGSATMSGPDSGIIDECSSFEGGLSENSLESSTYLEIATSTTIIQLVTVQALFSMDLLPRQEVPFTTLFPSPLDVCLGRACARNSALFSGNHADFVEAKSGDVERVSDTDEMDDAKELMDASDEENYHRLVGFQFPALPPTPALDTSRGSTPTTPASPTFKQWMKTWHDEEMSTWKAVLHGATEKESNAEEREAKFGLYAETWEDEQLSGWFVALKDDGGNKHLPRIRVDATNDKELGLETLEDYRAAHEDNGTSLLMTTGRVLGFA